jgi:hypothetical protein
MMAGADNEVMTAALFIIAILAIGPLAVFFGADSRRQSDRRSV